METAPNKKFVERGIMMSTTRDNKKILEELRTALTCSESKRTKDIMSANTRYLETIQSEEDCALLTKYMNCVTAISEMLSKDSKEYKAELLTKDIKEDEKEYKAYKKSFSLFRIEYDKLKSLQEKLQNEDIAEQPYQQILKEANELLKDSDMFFKNGFMDKLEQACDLTQSQWKNNVDLMNVMLQLTTRVQLISEQTTKIQDFNQKNTIAIIENQLTTDINRDKDLLNNDLKALRDNLEGLEQTLEHNKVLQSKICGPIKATLATYQDTYDKLNNDYQRPFYGAKLTLAAMIAIKKNMAILKVEVASTQQYIKEQKEWIEKRLTAKARLRRAANQLNGTSSTNNLDHILVKLQNNKSKINACTADIHALQDRYSFNCLRQFSTEFISSQKKSIDGIQKLIDKNNELKLQAEKYLIINDGIMTDKHYDEIENQINDLIKQQDKVRAEISDANDILAAQDMALEKTIDDLNQVEKTLSDRITHFNAETDDHIQHVARGYNTNITKLKKERTDKDKEYATCLNDQSINIQEINKKFNDDAAARITSIKTKLDKDKNSWFSQLLTFLSGCFWFIKNDKRDRLELQLQQANHLTTWYNQQCKYISVALSKPSSDTMTTIKTNNEFLQTKFDQSNLFNPSYLDLPKDITKRFDQYQTADQQLTYSILAEETKRDSFVIAEGKRRLNQLNADHDAVTSVLNRLTPTAGQKATHFSSSPLTQSKETLSDGSAFTFLSQVSNKLNKVVFGQKGPEPLKVKRL